MPHLILASTSRFRRALLERLGVAHQAVAPSFEEIAPEGMAPCDIARFFAEGKAQCTTAGPDTWVIGSDQVAELDGRILHKTKTLEDCRAQLQMLSGKTHLLHTAVALWSPSEKRMLAETVTVQMKMYPLEAAILDRYVELDQPIGSAGAYLFERRGVCLFESIGGGDESAIVGLPLMSVCRLLRQVGVEPISWCVG